MTLSGPFSLGWNVLKQDGGLVAVTGIRQNRYDQLASVPVLGHFDRGGHGRARRNSARDAFFPMQSASHFDGFIIGNRDDFIDDFHVEDIGLKAGADALNFVRAWFGVFTIKQLSQDG